MIEKSNDQEFVTFDNPVSQVKLSFEYPDISPIVKSRHKTSIDSEIAINQADENFISKKLHDRILLDLAMKHNIELEAERNHGMELFSKKAAEYEKLLTTNEKIKEKKFKQQHRSVELLEAELLDLQSAIHQCRLNEEIMKKQYQALIMQSEKQVKEYVDNLSKAREEIEYYKISKPLEIEKDIVTVRSRIENLNLQVDLKNREIREKDQQLLLIHSKFQDRERVLAELEQKILTLEQENLKQKEQQFEAGALKYNLEDEKRRRLSLENDYELLQKENETSRQRLRKELELNYSQQLNILDSKNRHLQDELEKLLTEKNTWFISSLTDQNGSHDEISSIQPDMTRDHIEGMKNYYDKRIKNLDTELSTWKNKAGELVSKYYSALKAIKGKLHHLKADTIRKQGIMREEFEDSLKLIIGKYGKALTNADAMVQNLTQKLAAVPEKKTGKVKTCKRNL